MVTPVKQTRQPGLLSRLKVIGRAMYGYNPDYYEYLSRRIDETKFELLSAEIAQENATFYTEMLRKRLGRLKQRLNET